ncbi:OsmC family protein [Bowmanella sp. Y26]|uniref:OsmC family protein n=1 Tax=Bowmanella yangjiangensis TaxID=2811230 RepID=A0ABS3CQ05_9ALTE|nr:OsmC family protein [Bowmanella yangjiangensis]MBN7819186.1 OsmC family protein [Bowmanella yangjiangensis]MBT1065863.1 OsmC family protein [Bowmanella yangjiangensis]
MQASVKWLDGYRFVGTSDSGHAVVMDGDKQSAASPMEMVMMAAGSCASVDVVSILKKAKQKVSGVEVKLSGERADAVPAVFTKLHLHFVVSGQGVSEKHVERAVNLSAEKYCSVSIMLGKSVEVGHSFEVVEAEF